MGSEEESGGSIPKGRKAQPPEEHWAAIWNAEALRAGVMARWSRFGDGFGVVTYPLVGMVAVFAELRNRRDEETKAAILFEDIAWALHEKGIPWAGYHVSPDGNSGAILAVSLSPEAVFNIAYKVWMDFCSITRYVEAHPNMAEWYAQTEDAARAVAMSSLGFPLPSVN